MIKIAAFDLDWTIIRPKSVGTFLKDVDDWTWYRPSVPEKIKSMHEKGFKIFIFTNQTREFKKDTIRNVISHFDFPITVGIGFGKNDPLRKPNRALFDKYVTEEWDHNSSVYVGDANSKITSWSDTDKIFAENVGINFMHPNIFFLIEDIIIPIWDCTVDKQEIVIMVGFPSSGKSTFARNNLVGFSDKYVHIERDVFKTVPKMLKLAETQLKMGNSIIFDATNGTVKAREPFITFAKKLNIYLRCIVMKTTFEESCLRNSNRIIHAVPMIAMYTFRKRYEIPSIKEGIDHIDSITKHDNSNDV
jgi:bifunctional polynucleotide phosphatase/kinase